MMNSGVVSTTPFLFPVQWAVPDTIAPELLAEFLTTVAGQQLLDDVITTLTLDGSDLNVLGRDFLAYRALMKKNQYQDLLDSDQPPRYLPLFTRPGDRELFLLILRIAEARRKAATRYPDAKSLFITQDMLAQATSATVAAYHADCLKPLGKITDLCSGAGMDSIAFAKAGMTVDAVELDPARLIFAEENARRCGVERQITFHHSDACDFPIRTAALFADPARRTEDGTRVSRFAEQYMPPLSVLVEKMTEVSGGCLKLSPLLPDEFLLSLGGRVEFLSDNRECKEACVWFGSAKGAGGDAPLSAVILPDRSTVAPDDSPKYVRPVGKFLYEPDPAVIRAGAVTAAARQLDAGYVSTEDVYLTGDLPLIDQSLARVYRVFSVMPFQRKEVAAFVRKAGFGRVVVKKRRARMEPEAVLAEIKASNRGPEPEILLVLIREVKGHSVVFCTLEPFPAPDSAGI